jgi:hypothetical protein
MAAKKRVDPLQAKAAKQKKIAIGGMVMLCLLLAIQGPKTLKMLKGPQAVTTAQPAPVTPVTPVPGGAPTPDPGAPAGGEATAAGASDLAAVSDSDPAPAAEAGQLVSFERFASKDPFAPQAEDVPAPVPTAGTDGGAGDGTATPGSDAGEAVDPAAPTPAGESAGGGGFTPAAPTPAAPALAAATSISVNGTPEDVKVDASFPAAQPTFVLVSVAKNGKSAQIGVAGGSYANGEPTIALKLGQKLTLQNTADGSRYELELLAVEGFAPPKSR